MTEMKGVVHCLLKKFLALFLCLALLVAALPTHTSAATESEKERICNQITKIYWKTLSSSGRGSLQGYCGTMAGYELYHLGITDIPLTYNGNDMYDVLYESEHICEGYNPQYYPATAYSLEEALNTITNGGRRDVYNIMVGFSWTSTAAGSRYGHVTVIHAILDGMVYFTEGFMTPFNSDPSQPMICTIEEFAEYYDRWTSLEGVIYFGSPNQIDGCEVYSCNMFLASEEPVTLLTRPNMEEAENDRTVPASERLQASALCVDANGNQYYQIVEEDNYFYVPVEQMEPVVFIHNDLTATGISLPSQLKEGEDFSLSGVVRSRYTKIYSVVFQVLNMAGETELYYEIQKDSYMVDLSARSINQQVDISILEPGCYTYQIYCNMLNYYCEDGIIMANVDQVVAASSTFTVGEAKLQTPKAVDAVAYTAEEGWQYENGSWYYYENGQPRIGWFCDNGVDYYLQESGAAATGWKNINGKDRYFSETGAMRIGWLDTNDGRYYMLSNGQPSKGPTEIDGQTYMFDENGLLVTDAVVVYEWSTYQTDNEGIVTSVY